MHGASFAISSNRRSFVSAHFGMARYAPNSNYRYITVLVSPIRGECPGGPLANVRNHFSICRCPGICSVCAAAGFWSPAATCPDRFSSIKSPTCCRTLSTGHLDAVVRQWTGPALSVPCWSQNSSITASKKQCQPLKERANRTSISHDCADPEAAGRITDTLTK